MKTIGKITGLSLLLFAEISTDAAQSPYGFRGPDRSGLYYETNLLEHWPEEGPALLWEINDAGKGYSSPVIYQDKVYLTGMNEDETREILSVYTLNGEKLYQVEYGTPWDKSYPETRTTPTIEDGKVYLISGSGEIVCLNASDGALIWQVDGGKEFERKTGKWGTSECPLVFDNKVIYTPGGDKTTMVALNAENGKTVWQSRPLNGHSGYVSPVLVMQNGVKKIVGMTSSHVFGVHPETGNIEWTFNEFGREGNGETIVTNMPIYDNGHLFFSNGYDVGAFMLRLNVNGSDASLVWRNDDLDTHHGGFVLVDGVIYGSNWINNNHGNWVALDWKTGKTNYEATWEGGKGKGSVITADNRLICYDERRGTVGLVNADPEKFDVVSEFRITKGEGPHWAHPVVDNGILYIRHGNNLMAYTIN